MKKLFSLLLCVFMLLPLGGCDYLRGSTSDTGAESDEVASADGGTAVPDLGGTDESSAKSILTSCGFVPVVEYEYSDSVAQGKVIRTEPKKGRNAAKGDKVKVYVSAGPSVTVCVTGQNTFSTNDFYDLYFNKPIISGGVLYIECFSDDPQEAFGWKNGSSGEGFGIASLDKDFANPTNLTVYFDSEYAHVKKNEHIDFTIAVAISGLGNKYPANLYTCLYAVRDDGSEKQIKIGFTLTW